MLTVRRHARRAPLQGPKLSPTGSHSGPVPLRQEVLTLRCAKPREHRTCKRLEQLCRRIARPVLCGERAQLHTKWTGSQWAVQQLLGRPLDPAGRVYGGDVTNDQVMFERVASSVGVANIARFVPQLQVPPAWVTQAERGRGLAELT